MNFTILRFDTIRSTNAEASNQARQGAGEGLCVVARQQTAGRGRHGRVWISEKDAGLYCSLVLRPRFATKFFPLVTLAAAVAVADALGELYDLRADIKWANDVLVGGRKICGILAEMIETGGAATVVLGVGVNLKSANFPPELRETATAVEEESAETPDAEILLQTLLRRFDRLYVLLHEADGARKIRGEWARRSSYFSGAPVRVALSGETFDGTTRGLEENGALRVETESGALRVVQAGDVERLRRIPADAAALD